MPDPSIATVTELRSAIEQSNAILDQVSQNLEILRKRTIWNRIIVVILGTVLLAVVILGMGLVHESRQADHNLQLAYLNSCDRSNELIARSNEQERTFVTALARFTHADPMTVKEFQDFLKDLRGSSLDPIDCAKDN